MVARVEAERDGIQVPLTLEDYCIKTQVLQYSNFRNRPPSNETKLFQVKPSNSESQVEMTDFYDDDYDEDYEDLSDDSDYVDEDDNDSGNGES